MFPTAFTLSLVSTFSSTAIVARKDETSLCNPTFLQGCWGILGRGPYSLAKYVLEGAIKWVLPHPVTVDIRAYIKGYICIYNCVTDIIQLFQSRGSTQASVGYLSLLNVRQLCLAGLS